jgi:hypothetical protein
MALFSFKKKQDSKAEARAEEEAPTPTLSTTTAQSDSANPEKNENIKSTVSKGSVPTAPSDDEVEYPHGLKLTLILFALCCSVFLVALDQTIISTAIPKITDQFNSIQDIGWYGSSYLLTATALQPTFGRIYTIFSVLIN